MEHHLSRPVAIGLIAMLGISASARPTHAEARRASPRTASLAQLSSASLHVLASALPRKAAAAQGRTSPNSSFFKTRKGATAIALMAAGTVLTVWSINHDRKPVKSPIR
jgi:hypothetical protein